MALMAMVLVMIMMPFLADRWNTLVAVSHTKAIALMTMVGVRMVMVMHMVVAEVMLPWMVASLVLVIHNELTLVLQTIVMVMTMVQHPRQVLVLLQLQMVQLQPRPQVS